MSQESSAPLDYSILLVIIIGSFMAMLDGTIVNVTLPRLMAVFGASPDRIQWVVTIYMLTLGIVMPVSGYLGDTFGYKRLYMASLAVFVAGSALCGLAWNLDALIGARVLQAVGGGIMQPVGMAMLYHNYPRSRMGMVLGLWGISAMLAPAVGPTLGGYLVDSVSWRVIFYLNLPIGVVNLFLASVILDETERLVGKHFDLVGLVSASVGLFCLLLALSQGNQHGWSSPYIVSLLAVSGVSLAVLAVNEWFHPEPILDLSLLKNSLFTISLVIGSILAIGMFGVIFLVPLLLQSVFGLRAMTTGLIMFPAALASGLMMPLSGKMFDRYGPRGVVLTGLAVVVWTTYMMADFNQMTPYLVMSAWLALRGIGMGLSFMPVNTAGMNTVPLRLVGRASALSNVVRQVASSLGVAMFTSIMQHRHAFHLANLAASAKLDNSQGEALASALQGIATASGMGAAAVPLLGGNILYSMAVREAMVNAIADCFIVSAALCTVALVLALRLKRSAPHLEPASLPAAAVEA